MRVMDDDGVGVATLMMLLMMNLITIATRTTTEDGVEAARRFRKVNAGIVMMTAVVARRIPTGLGLGRR